MITQWSVSRYKDWVKCPFYAKCKHVDKLKEPENPAMARGTAVHKQMEYYLHGQAHTFQEIHPSWVPKLAQLKDVGGESEYQLAVRRDWSITGWFDKDCWGRVVIDVATFLPEEKTIILRDFKTGKMRDDYWDQLEVYTCVGVSLMPDAVTIKNELLYLDHPSVEGHVVQIVPADTVAGLRKKWEDNIGKMEADRTFPPIPGKHCSWCAFSRHRGGPCPSH